MKQKFIDQLNDLILTYQTQTAMDIFSNVDSSIPNEILVKVGPLLYEVKNLIEAQE